MIAEFRRGPAIVHACWFIVIVIRTLNVAVVTQCYICPALVVHWLTGSTVMLRGAFQHPGQHLGRLVSSRLFSEYSVCQRALNITFFNC